MKGVLGWDIGGVNTKAARVAGSRVVAVRAAAARLVARSFPDCILIDVGSTTTDIIPIAGGVPAALGRTDPERLCEGELVYTGALRTPAEAIATHVPLGGKPTGVSAEGFALAGDVHVWRRQLAPCG